MHTYILYNMYNIKNIKNTSKLNKYKYINTLKPIYCEYTVYKSIDKCYILLYFI